MQTPENKEKQKIKKYLISRGAYMFWPVQRGMGAAGLDCYACVDCIYVGIEVKAPEKEPTPRQYTIMQEIKRAGGYAVWGTAAKVIDELEQLRHSYHYANR